MTRQPLKKPNRHPVDKEFSLLGIGLPRSGTGYTHMLLRRFGLDVGHELIRPDGCVDWRLSLQPKSKKHFRIDSLPLFKRGLVIRSVRNPSTTIPSFIKRVIMRESAFKFVKNNLSLNLSRLNKLEKCIEAMFAFEEAIDRWNPDYIFKIESSANNLFDFLSQHYHDLHPYDQKLVNEVKFYNRGNHGGWTPELTGLRNSLKKPYKNKINSMCRKHDYPPMF